MLVAASLPPTCGSYAASAFDPEHAARVLAVLIPALAPHVDLWLAETLGSVAEARAADAALRSAGLRSSDAGSDGRPLWLSFTLRGDDGGAGLSPPCLLSGESVADAVSAALELRAEALLFNCAAPELMRAALAAALAALEAAGGAHLLRLGVYANAFAETAPPFKAAATSTANAVLLPLRPDLTPDAYAAFAAEWRAAGATVIGGCCGVGPEHIAALKAAVRRSAP